MRFYRLLYLLFPFSILYGLVVRLRNYLYDLNILRSYQFDIPIVSIGNISVGGTGKTPMAEFLLSWLLAQDIKVAYLSRGYGRKTKGLVWVNPEESTAKEVGDEALQVASKFSSVPVVVCEDRVNGVKALIESKKPDCILLDDAFQHRRLARTLDVVMIDANRPPWNDNLLPVGGLREPISSLSRADLVVINKVKSKKSIARYMDHVNQPTCFAEVAPLRLVSFSGRDYLTLDSLFHRHCIAFSALGNNTAFLDQLIEVGLRPVRFHGYGDHHFYRESELKQITRQYRRLVRSGVLSQEPIIVTTEKDYSRLMDIPWFELQFAQFPFYFLEISLRLLEGEEALTSVFEPIIAGISRSQSDESGARAAL